MPWEKRKRGSRYYTRSRRENGKIVREYIGTGLIAEAAAASDQAKRSLNKLFRQMWELERTRVDMLEAQVDKLDQTCKSFLEVELQVAENGGQNVTNRNTERETIENLLVRMQKGDQQAKVQFVRNYPSLWSEILERAGELGKNTIKALVENLSGDDLLASEGISTKVSRLRGELGGENPTPLEQLLVDRIISCWLQANHADLQVAGRRNMTPAQSRFFERWQNQANRRFTRGCKDLAVVQKSLHQSVEHPPADRG